MSNVVTAELVLTLVLPGETSWPVAAHVAFDASDPYAVSVTFLTGDGAEEDAGEGVCWTFARQLLTDGITRPVGVGDVRVHPLQGDNGAVVVLQMTSPHGEATFEAAMHDVVEFLADTYALVPTGSESAYVDVDAAIARILLG